IYLRSKRLTLLDYLAALYDRHGYHAERPGRLTFPGAAGDQAKRSLLTSYVAEPPRQWAGVPVVSYKNFDKDEVIDADGERVPRELMLAYYLADDTRIFVRASGTE